VGCCRVNVWTDVSVNGRWLGAYLDGYVDRFVVGWMYGGMCR